MKILGFSDAHLRDNGSFAPFNKIDEETGLTNEILNTIEGFHFVAEQIKEFKPDYVMFLGDFYHVPEFITTRTLHAASIALSIISEACKSVGCEFVMMPGNHDVLNENFGITSINNLVGYATILPLDTNVYFDKGEHRCCIVPFNSDGKVFTANFHKAKEDGAKLIMTHQDFEGCKYESGYPSESKISPRIGVPVIAGDIHLQQKVGDVTYCGSLVQNRFNRRDLLGIGGIVTYDMETKEMKCVKNNKSRHYVKVTDFDQLTYLNPDRCVLNITMKVDPKKLEDYLKENGFEHYIHINRNNKIVLEDNPEMIEAKSVSPLKSLRSHILKNNEGAVPCYDEIINGFKDIS